MAALPHLLPMKTHFGFKDLYIAADWIDIMRGVKEKLLRGRQKTARRQVNKKISG